MTTTALLAALGALAPAAAFAQPSGRADAPKPADAQSQAEGLAARAFEAYSKGDYAGALVLYQQAGQITPAAAIYFNIANIYEKKLPDAKLAVEFYRKCVAAADATPDLTLKATARIQSLSVDAAQKRDASQPGAPAAPPQGAPPQGAPPQGAPPQGAPPPNATEDTGKPFKIGGGVLVGVGAVLLGAGTGFGVDAKSKLDTARMTCTGSMCTRQSGVDAMNAANTSATASTAMFVVGGVVAATGLGLLLFAPSKKAPAPAAALRLAPALGSTSAGLILGGVF